MLVHELACPNDGCVHDYDLLDKLQLLLLGFIEKQQGLGNHARTHI